MNKLWLAVGALAAYLVLSGSGSGGSSGLPDLTGITTMYFAGDSHAEVLGPKVLAPFNAAGVSGDFMFNRGKDLAWYLSSGAIAGKSADLIMIESGTNDAPASYDALYASMSGLIQSLGPHRAVIFVGPPQIQRSDISARAAQVGQWMAQAASALGVGFIDSSFMDSGWYDQVHFDNAGYQRWANGILDTLGVPHA